MAKIKLTAGRVSNFICSPSKSQDFLWCSDSPGLAVRATKGSENKRYIFQAKVKSKTMRVTIGRVDVWSIEEAQSEARRLQVQIDNGLDPRAVKKESELAANDLAEQKRRQSDALALEAKLNAVTFFEAWSVYISERNKHWSPRNISDHQQLIQVGGEKRKRSKDPIVAGPLAQFRSVRLKDLSLRMVSDWANKEGAKRPARARLAFRVMKAFLFWCSTNETYGQLVDIKIVQNKFIRESLGKPTTKEDVLQYEQLKDWFEAVRQITNKSVAAYLQILLLTGRRREEVLNLRWENIDFKWKSITIKDKVKKEMVIPLTPYVENLLQALPRKNVWVFYSSVSKSGRIVDPSDAHRRACAIADLNLTLHGLRRSFATLSEWVEVPAGISAQIQGHAPQGVRENNYIRRPLDLLRMWHIKIESWILEKAKIEFEESPVGLSLVK